eukprot:scaffold2983_cov123-Cylindrotheca_fusiformis.AAC.10
MTLLFSAYNAYLSPLLKKHEAGQYLVWEDLEASRAASAEVLESSDNIFVSVRYGGESGMQITPTKRVDKLHQSQVKAYQEAGLKALREWAQTLALEPMDDGDTKETFVKRCLLASTKSSPPNWKGLTNPKQIISEEVQKRATEVYEKYRPENSEGEAEPSEGEGETEGEPSEEGETEEEADGADQKAADSSFTPKTKNKLKNKTRNKVAKKKGTGAKGGMRKNFTGNRRGKKAAAANSKSA